jgi:hypothetical protein
MDEAVHGFADSTEARKASVFFSEKISELLECALQIRCGIRTLYTMMQMNLYFAQPFCLKFRQLIQKRCVVLLARIEIRVTKWRAVNVVKGSTYSTGLLAPVFKPGKLCCPIRRKVLLVP